MDATRSYCVSGRKGYDPQFGCRPVKRVIQQRRINKLSKEILAGKIATDSIILLDAFNGVVLETNRRLVE
jgi:ATP-dependent Clp protease ATP-binding subunit ClpB